MFFYEVNALIGGKKIEYDGSRSARQYARKIAAKTSHFNQKYIRSKYFLVSDFNGDTVTCALISDTDDVQSCVNDYLDAIEVETTDVQISEITFSVFQSLLRTGARVWLSDDDDDVLEQIGLGELNTRLIRRGTSYTEYMLSPATDKDTLYAESKRLLSEMTLTPELDRIYSGKSNVKAFGHPVHYFAEADNAEVEKVFYETLLQALYDNGRLKSRRYCVIDFSLRSEFSYSFYDTLYKSCTGGAVVVKCPAIDEHADGRFADERLEILSAVCEAMRKYRNHVLTIISLPRVCERTKKAIFEKLGDIGVVEIKEDCSDYVKAKEYLNMLCKQGHIRIDNQLLGRLERDKLYYPDELHAFFDEWYNEKMRTTVYPQYRDVAVCRKEAVKEVAQGCAYDDLQAMIGLTEAKAVIGKALKYYKLQRIYADKGIKQDRPAMHMVFKGNPGTAKTTVARLFARIMKENGLLSRGHLVEVGRSDLVGKYVGWTAQIVKEKFAKAMGGVLFIDEAYSLVDERGLFGEEAINTIVQEMENRREDLVVIFAGYPKEMDKFLNQNPGLRSRIAFHVNFADYSTPELCDIARMIGKEKAVTLTDGAIDKLSAVFDTARQNPAFGNGRYVRNAIELAKMNQAERILSENIDDVTDDMLTTLEAEDIEMPETETKAEKRRIGFGN